MVVVRGRVVVKEEMCDMRRECISVWRRTNGVVGWWGQKISGGVKII